MQAAPTNTRSRPMTDSSKIQLTHTQRAAFVYIRQSTPGQVEHNRESTARQYALADRACQAGLGQGAGRDHGIGYCSTAFGPVNDTRSDKSSIIAKPPPASTPWPIERARLGWAKERVVIMGLATAQLRSDR